MRTELLKEEMRPKIANIAQLNEFFHIRYTQYDKTRRYSSEKTLDTTWLDIFKAVGPLFYSPGQKRTIKYAIERLIVDRSMGVLPVSLGDIFANAIDIDKIKIQMAAYGFLKIYSAQVLNAGLGEFIVLTDFGNRVLLEASAVRTALKNAAS